MTQSGKKTAILFEKYSIAGGISFLLELMLLYILTGASVPYYVSIPSAFILSTFVQFLICHAWVFAKSGRTASVEYGYFLSILISGLILTSVIALPLIRFFGINIYIARIGAGIFTWLWDFYLNARFNFRSRVFKKS